MATSANLDARDARLLQLIGEVKAVFAEFRAEFRAELRAGFKADITTTVHQVADKAFQTSPPAHLAQPAPVAPPAAPAALPPAPPELPPQPITAPVPTRSYPPSPSVETIEEVEQKQVYKPLRNVKQLGQKHRASKTVPTIYVAKFFEDCIGWPPKLGGIDMRFSRDKEPDAWYTTMLNHKRKLTTGAMPNPA